MLGVLDCKDGLICSVLVYSLFVRSDMRFLDAARIKPLYSHLTFSSSKIVRTHIQSLLAFRYSIAPCIPLDRFAGFAEGSCCRFVSRPILTRLLVSSRLPCTAAGVYVLVIPSLI